MMFNLAQKMLAAFFPAGIPRIGSEYNYKPIHNKRIKNPDEHGFPGAKLMRKANLGTLTIRRGRSA